MRGSYGSADISEGDPEEGNGEEGEAEKSGGASIDGRVVWRISLQRN